MPAVVWKQQKHIFRIIVSENRNRSAMGLTGSSVF